ncbi:MAG: cation transporter [Rhodocyclaceae bacterium]
MNEIELFRRFAAHVQIAHHIPGRIRLKLAPVKLDDEERAAVSRAKGFQKALDSIPGVKSIRLNLLARSCTVEYDTGIIPAAAWPDVLGAVDSPAARALMDILVRKYAEAVNAQP